MLIPIPQTTRRPVASSRIPATLPPSISTSFCHFTSARTIASRSSADATAAPPRARAGGGAHRRGLEQQREEQVRGRRVLPAPARPAPPRGLVLGQSDGAVRVVAVAQHVLRRAGLDEVEVRLAERAAQQRAEPLGPELTHRTTHRRPTRRSRFVAPRRFFASSRFSRAARDGFVGTRLRSTRSASARRATSRSIASSRLRSWLRSSCATARSTGPDLATTRC